MKLTLRSAGAAGSTGDCGDAGAVGGKAKRHNFHAVEFVRLLEQLSESVSLHLEKGTFGLVQARIDKHNPV